MSRARLHHLSNGLQVVLDPMRTVESLTLGVWIRAGSRHEPANLSGLAHLLEHMVFKGTRARSSFDIVSQIEGQGGSINAYTSRENTAYYCRLLKDDLTLGLDILVDLIANATLRPVDLNKERQVILQELHQAADTPDDIIFDHFQETAFPNQGLGRSVLGSEQVLKTVQEAPLRSFYTSAYGARSMTLVLSGKFDEGVVLPLIQERFGALPSGHLLGFEPATYVGGEYVEVRPDLEQVHLLIGWPGAALEGPGYYAQMLISTILGGGMSSRLFQKVREEAGLAYSVSAFLSAFQDVGLFGVYAGTDPDQLSALLPLIATTMRAMTQDVSEEELARAKQLLKASLLMGHESTLARAEGYASQVQVFGKIMSTDELLAPLEAVSVDQVKSALGDLMKGKMTLALIGPQEEAYSAARLSQIFA